MDFGIGRPCAGRLRTALFCLILTQFGCDDGSTSDGLSWALNGEKTGIFSKTSSFGSCFFNLPSAVTDEHHVSFVAHFEDHPEISMFLFDLTPFPSMDQQRTLGVGRMGVYAHNEDVYTPGLGNHGFYVDIFGRAEFSVGDTVQDEFSGRATEFFIHTLVLPKQTLSAPGERTFEIEESRFTDLRFYCQDAGGLP